MRAEDEVQNEDYEASDNNDDPEDEAKDGEKPCQELGFVWPRGLEWLFVVGRCLNRWRRHSRAGM